MPTTYNIYGYDSDKGEDQPLRCTVVVSDDDTEIDSITSEEPAIKQEAKEVLESYIRYGFTASEAVSRYAGTYGDVKEAGADKPVVSAVEKVENIEISPPEEVTTSESQPASTASDTEPFTLGDGVMAMTEEDGTVVTLLKRDPTSGAVYRHDGEWLPLVDPTVLDELTFVGVTDEAEAVYDEHEAKDELVSIGRYTPSADGPYWPHPVRLYEDGDESDIEEVEAEDEEEEVLTASVTLNSEADLTEAIAAAANDPDLRWYVERRVAALGLEASLPWLEV